MYAFVAQILFELHYSMWKCKFSNFCVFVKNVKITEQNAKNAKSQKNWYLLCDIIWAMKQKASPDHFHLLPSISSLGAREWKVYYDDIEMIAWIWFTLR